MYLPEAECWNAVGCGFPPALLPNFTFCTQAKQYTLRSHIAWSHCFRKACHCAMPEMCSVLCGPLHFTLDPLQARPSVGLSHWLRRMARPWSSHSPRGRPSSVGSGLKSVLWVRSFDGCLPASPSSLKLYLFLGPLTGIHPFCGLVKKVNFIHHLRILNISYVITCFLCWCVACLFVVKCT